MKIIGMMAVYNDEDFISEVIENLITQGIQLIVLDDGSQDNTLKICKTYLGNGILQVFQHKTNSWNLEQNFRILLDLALRESPDWLVIVGSDELLESGTTGLSLKDAIIRADNDNYNLIQFDVFNFFMTDNDNESAKSNKEKLKYYSWKSDWVYRAWKFIPGIRLHHGGHYPIYPEGIKYKLFPNKFVIRHYKTRSKKQYKKMLRDRVERMKDTPLEKLGFYEHYKNFVENDVNMIEEHKLLTKYNEDNNWNYEIKFAYGHNMLSNENISQNIISEDGKLIPIHPFETGWKLDSKNLHREITNLQKKIEQIQSEKE